MANLTLRKKGITVEIRGAMSYRQGVDGNFTVQLSRRRGGYVESYTPGWDSTGSKPSRNGAYLNVPATNNQLGYPNVAVEDFRIQLPLHVQPGDAVIFTKSVDTVPIARADYIGVPGASKVAEALAIVFVHWDPNQPGMTPFRPPAIGNGAYTAAMRDQPVWQTAQIDVSALPSEIVLGDLTESVAPKAYLEGLFADFCGDYVAGWGTHLSSPDLQFPGYGDWFGSSVSQALCYLCSTETTANKTTLAYRIAQWAIDYGGMYADGRRTRVEGGHGQGRKALIMAGGFLLNWGPFKDPGAFAASEVMFEEDDAAYADEDWWHGEWTVGWQFNSSEGVGARFVQNAPSTWGNVATHGSNAWKFAGYYQHVHACQVGAALAMRLMGLESQYGRMLTAVDQWMAGPSNGAKTALSNIGITLPWGTSYGVDYPLWCGEAYVNHNP